MTSQEPDVEKVFQIIGDTLKHFKTKEGIILLSSFLLLVVWGPKGDTILLPLFNQWLMPDQADRAFQLQLVSYSIGLLLLVLIPFLLIHFRFHGRFVDYGLGIGDTRWGWMTFLVIVGISLPLFYFGSMKQDMWKEYPLIYRGLNTDQIKQHFRWNVFLMYELLYASFFFIIEFTFRGYLLFGLKERFGRYAILIQMLSYTAWHLPKPATELVGTPVWGIAVAAVALRVNSLWYVFLAHWLLNVFLDLLILSNRGVI
ncbi:MAG: CPBP family intramembrane metalloprotease [Ignavibacteriae bacterium]|nr:CPBP family intramembrane metalloprotease [Ignavibacteriota bacterium]